MKTSLARRESWAHVHAAAAAASASARSIDRARELCSLSVGPCVQGTASRSPSVQRHQSMNVRACLRHIWRHAEQHGCQQPVSTQPAAATLSSVPGFCLMTSPPALRPSQDLSTYE